jgi:hypothetical protein
MSNKAHKHIPLETKEKEEQSLFLKDEKKNHFGT